MTPREIIETQLQTCWNQNGWFTSMATSVNELTEDQASWKNSDETNSIHEIVSHLNFYNERYLNRFLGESVPSFEGDNDDTFAKAQSESQSWKDTIEAYNQVMNQWIQAVKKSEDENLDRWLQDLTHLTIHNAYHIGQIVTIRKQQGSWDATKGVS